MNQNTVALTALCVNANDYTAVGYDADGWIILPPWNFIQDWAREYLCGNASDEAISKGGPSRLFVSRGH